ncbi:MAG: L,D-transpeptidase [Candidatus Levybacteria bacterium]|nr:L,D-transpeptidase [Candidatus Levybacteria bacterium]
MAYRKVKRNVRTVWHYFKLYFILLFISVAIFTIGSFFKPQAHCANSLTCKSDLSLNVNNNAVGVFHGHKITPPKIDLAMETSQTSVLGINVSNSNKHIYVDLSTQTLYAYEGSNKFMQVLISSGKWGRTPVGNYNIWTKLRSTRMSGGQGADYYDLPNVPWVMYFYNDFGLHGAYWHNNFGYPMSHGCVNMRPVDAHKLFDWVDGPIKDKRGTAVSVCNQFIEPNKCIQA